MRGGQDPGQMGLCPHPALGRTLGDRLVFEGTNWANLRFVSPLDIALGMGAPLLEHVGLTPNDVAGLMERWIATRAEI
ncbi:MAG: hypothetical protein ABI647_11040 [Gemmatimonadota bacterium]